MISAQSNLTIIGLNTPTPQVFWKGIKIAGITSIKVDWEEDEQRVKLKLVSLSFDAYADIIEEMRAAGIIIREV